ncbi:MAG: FAD-dependent oxidoreductase [Spirochaetales bacterium]|nr:FAD-dependent oxidoreductase [Spirochaetales bacterium]
MTEKKYDSVIIGGGSAGMAAACRIAEAGYSCAIVERETALGGILNQCIHNGFGLHHFKEELTGPEYAERFIQAVKDKGLDVYLETTVMDIEDTGSMKSFYGYSSVYGLLHFSCRSIVLAMGCRERNRGNIGTPGTRPSGIFTAGLAQRLVNIDGYIPGKKIVIVGSGDIGLIMARRMTWVGTEVLGVVEIQPYPAGLTRNIVQCLTDFNIPLHLSHVVSKIWGKERVEGVRVSPVGTEEGGNRASFDLDCDTLLLSVGLVPDNEISKKAGVDLNPETGGALVDSRLMTSVEGIFACGNVLHVHDLVDFVTEESQRCGEAVCHYLKGVAPGRQYRTVSGANVKYVLPNMYNPDGDNRFYLRPLVVKNGAELVVKIEGREVIRKKLRHVQPSEMVSFTLDREEIPSLESSRGNTLETGIL